MDLSAISAAGQSFAALRQIAGALAEIRDFTKLASVRAELLERIVDAQGAMLELQEAASSHLQTINALKEEIAQLKKVVAERESYELYEIRPGAFVYRSKPGMGDSVPTHYLCQPCYDRGIKAVLEAQSSRVHGRQQNCPFCHRDINLE